MNKQNTQILFDGFCFLCSAFAQKLIKKLKGEVDVIAMQSERGEILLQQHKLALQPDEVIVINVNGEIISGAPAILFLLDLTKGFWRFCGKVASILPKRVISLLYRLISKNRYLLFGKRKTCYIPHS